MSPDTPAAARSLLRDCLEKDPERRPPDMAAARLAIDDALSRLNQPLESTQATERAALPVPMTAGRHVPRSRTQGPYVGRGGGRHRAVPGDDRSLEIIGDPGSSACRLRR